MGKLIVIGTIWLLVFAVTLVMIDSQLNVKEPVQSPDDTQNPPDQGDSAASGFVVLQVDGYVVDDFWERGMHDLPMMTFVINYVVSNLGNVSANAVTIKIMLDSDHYSTETIYGLAPNFEFRDTFSLAADYDQSKVVEVEANFENISDSWSHVLEAELPRDPSWSLSRLFITPQEISVKSTYQEIMSGSIFVHWIEIRDWVGSNIEYIEDYNTYGVDKFWQLGKETLERRTGDCEDFAILLCSMLRADGWSTEDVYVVIGENEVGEYHAWVKVRIPYLGLWYNIEPTASGFHTGPLDVLVLSGYTPLYNFNDQYFIIV
ncbi:MAG: transglutaminase domain-containing protein [Candidatus Bathyarchaeota archaeon]|nr:MAG: transglutaminase domain-containing protein [Candidatus Bathyarchaeota archaeon]